MFHNKMMFFFWTFVYNPTNLTVWQYLTVSPNLFDPFTMSFTIDLGEIWGKSHESSTTGQVVPGSRSSRTPKVTPTGAARARVKIQGPGSPKMGTSWWFHGDYIRKKWWFQGENMENLWKRFHGKRIGIPCKKPSKPWDKIGIQPTKMVV